MKVIMLGWEYPPHISGGLGTACEGLTQGLARKGVSIDFIVPHLYGGEVATHMNLREVPSVMKIQSTSAKSLVSPQAPNALVPEVQVEVTQRAATCPTESIETTWVASFLQPYIRELQVSLHRRPGLAPELIQRLNEKKGPLGERVLPEVIEGLFTWESTVSHWDNHYQGDLFDEVGRYAALIGSLREKSDADLIHAHDWMTFPAGLLLKALTGLPLVAHVHSLEFDRTGGGGNSRIEEIERAGILGADRVIAVSYYTRSLIHRRYGVPLGKISVVHNGVYACALDKNGSHGAEDVPQGERIQDPVLSSKVVLFLGRVTFQKGPDYFVEAAARVIPHIPDVLFVMAGSGDMLPRMMDRVTELGIGRHFLFTGFLKGKDVEKMYSAASLYVMPSVSEPFGIAPLEAISHNTPVIISRQSGVSEVLRHALKVDFWDVDELANLIIAALRYSALQKDMVELAGQEVRSLHWDASAEHTLTAYSHMLARIGSGRRGYIHSRR